MDSELLERLEAALYEDALERLIQEMKAQELRQVEIYDAFEQFRERLHQAGREEDEDKVVDIMDCILGWCSPAGAFFGHYLTQEEIEAYRRNRLKVESA